MKRFEKILQDIRDVKIQGATDVAKAGIKAFLISPDKNSAKKILAARPTEPLLQNALKFLLKSRNLKSDSKFFLDYIKKSQKVIAKKGAVKIRQDANIFTHCHSSTVIEILKQAKKFKKKFVVYTTEVEPLLQGRQTAEELAKSGIKVIISPDLAAPQLLKKCSILLFGADAFSKKGIANKIGTSTLCKLAKQMNIPRYACAISLKFAKKIKLETRPGKEVWDEKNKNIKVINPAFDFTPKKLLTGVISEFGILPYSKFVKKAKQNLKRFC